MTQSCAIVMKHENYSLKHDRHNCNLLSPNKYIITLVKTTVFSNLNMSRPHWHNINLILCQFYFKNFNTRQL